MSEMVANRGIIKELYPEIDNIEDKVKRLCSDTGLDFNAMLPFIEDEYIDHDDYALVNGRLFDISNAPNEYDNGEGREYIKKISNTEYEIDMYYYNGGTCLQEMIEDNIDKADKEYNNLKFVKFTENNDHEAETWNFWLQYNGNEEELNKLYSILNDESLCDYDDCPYEFSLVAYPENEVDILVKHSRSGYMDYETKISGKFICPNFENSDDLYDALYKGGIKEYWSAE